MYTQRLLCAGDCSMSSWSTGVVQVARVGTRLHWAHYASAYRRLRLSLRHLRKSTICWTVYLESLLINKMLLLQYCTMLSASTWQVAVSWAAYGDLIMGRCRLVTVLCLWSDPAGVPPRYPIIPAGCIDVINVCNVYNKFLINAFVIFVNVYYFNKRHMKI